MWLVSSPNVHNMSVEASSEDTIERMCCEDNLEDCAQYVNKEIMLMGIPSILRNNEPDSVLLLNALHDLILLYRSSMHKIENVNTSLFRARSDLTLEKEALARSRKEIEIFQKTISESNQKELLLNQQKKVLEVNLKAGQEQIKRLKQSMTHRNSQYSHELKRKDQECEKLKERLRQVVADKTHEKKMGIKILNTLRSSHGQQKATQSGDDTYKLVVRHYEERQKDLILENNCLREYLCNMERELARLLNHQSDTSRLMDDSHIEVTSSPRASSGDKTERYQMPFSMARQAIEQSLEDKYDQLRQKILAKSQPEDFSGEDITDIRQQLAEYRDIIEQQEKIIMKALQEEQLQDDKSERLNVSHLFRKEEMLNIREERVKEKETVLHSLENKITDASKQLDQERLHFEENKENFFKQQFLDASIFDTPRKGLEASSYCGVSSTPFMFSAHKIHAPLKIQFQPTDEPEGSVRKTIDFKQNLSLSSNDGVDVVTVT